MAGFATYDKGGGIPGTTVYADNVDFTGTGRTNTITTNGQLLIGATSANAGGNHINVGSIVSNDSSLTIGYISPNINLQVTGGTSVLKTLTPDSGGVQSPTAGNINMLGTGSVTTVGSGSTITTQMTGLTNHAVLVGAGTATITKVGPTATAGQVLQSAGAAADPAFSTATYPSTTTINQVLYSSSANVVGGITAANNGTMISGATGIPSWLANGTTGQVLTATTSSPPSWGTAPITQVTGQIFTSSGAFTYTPTSGMKYVIVELQGGGGGSGGVAATSAAVSLSASAGGGAYAKFILTAAQVGASLSGSVGAGGTAGASGNNNGGTGGSTTLATSSAWTAAGGAGGAGGASAAASAVAGAGGGAVTTGTGTLLLNSPGSNGGYGAVNTTINLFFTGNGGYSQMGRGGAIGTSTPINTQIGGQSGFGFGAGASGVCNFGTVGAQAGVAGTIGIAIFTEFL